MTKKAKAKKGKKRPWRLVIKMRGGYWNRAKCDDFYVQLVGGNGKPSCNPNEGYTRHASAVRAARRAVEAGKQGFIIEDRTGDKHKGG